MHILGNMFYLWGFGLVVEGKLGWWRFLLLYLAVGAISSAVEQVAMLGGQGAALGASGAIFGLMAIALIWAPKNEMSCFLWFMFRPIEVEVPISIFATTYLIWQGIVAWLTHFSMSSAMLHLTGAGVGAVFGVALLKLDYVDCEGWDLFAVWKGTVGSRTGRTSKTNMPELPRLAPAPERLSEQQSQFLAAALRTRLQQGDAAGAAQLYQKQREKQPAWKLNAADLTALIQALHGQNLWSESVPAMIDYLRQFPEHSASMRMKLAQILTEIVHCPAKAVKVLSKVSPAELTPELQASLQELMARAEQLRVDSDFEFVDDVDV
jgi:hypothetical protein